MLIGARPGPDHGRQRLGQADRDVVGDTPDLQEPVAQFLGRGTGGRDIDVAEAIPVTAAIRHALDRQSGLIAEFGIASRPRVFPDAMIDAQNDLVGIGVRRELIQDDSRDAGVSPGWLAGPHAGVVLRGVGHRGPGLQAQLGALASGQGVQVAGDGAAGEEIGRADDRVDLAGGEFRLAQELADRLDDRGRMVGRPGALPVGVAVDEPDRHRRDLAALGRQGNLADRR